MNRVNDRVFKTNQWITIVDTKIAASASTDRIMGLVETFAADVYDAASNQHEGGASMTMRPRVNKYNVNGNVGVMIAQKLRDGESLRVGRNGEEVVNPPTGGESDFFKDIKKR